MIDTHAHIRKDDEIRGRGLEWIILSASDIDDSKTNIELASVHPTLRAAVGTHPQAEGLEVEYILSELEKLLMENKDIIAVGECGLDFSQEYNLEWQTKVFEGQIDLAIKYRKPLIIHSRKAMDETMAILSKYQRLRGVIHCYSGGKKRIPKVLEMSGEWYFGIDGNLTYENGLQEVVKNIPKDRLLLETDSPELTPIPFRGEKNCPEYVEYIYQKVSELWEMNFEETVRIIDENAKRLFQL